MELKVWVYDDKTDGAYALTGSVSLLGNMLNLHICEKNVELRMAMDWRDLVTVLMRVINGA